MPTYNEKRNLSTCQYSYHFKRWYFFLGSALLCLSPLSLSAQTVSSASIEHDDSNQLTVTFSEPITVSNADGFRLVGGVARIDNLLSGSGSNTLTFTLTDYVLPDDAFRLLHWPEMSDARGSSGKLGEIDQVVNNQALAYNSSSGTLFHVSDSEGSDIGNDRGGEDKPYKTIVAAQSVAGPGDYILLKRGDTFDGFVVTKSGSEGSPITFASYGDSDDPKPVIKEDTETSSQDIAIAATNKDYISINNLHIEHVDGGAYFFGNCSYLIISNCTIVGVKKSGRAGIRLVRESGSEQVFTYPQILNNDVSGCDTGIMLNGFPYDEGAGKEYKVRGGIVENNTTSNHVNTRTADGITVNRSDFEFLVVRKNDISGWSDDGIDMFAASNLIVEYNTLHNPLDNPKNGKGIKAGGKTKDDIVKNYSGGNLTVRYNIVRDLNSISCVACDGISTNQGASGTIYGNLVYNTGKNGITLDRPQDWTVHNNTVFNANNLGIETYFETVAEGNAATLTIKNNIAQGRKRNQNNEIIDIEISNRGNPNLDISNNATFNETGGAYQSSDDILINSANSLFVNPGERDYRLQIGSPAVDVGTANTPPYDRDIRGFLVDSNPDIGAYEFGDQIGPLDPPVSSNPGVNYAYYEGNWSQLPDFSNLSSVATGTLDNFSLSPAQRANEYGFVYKAFLEVSTAGSYTFYTTSDDGSALYINNQLVVDNDGLHAARERSGSISLIPGRHAIEVQFFERFNRQTLEARYAGPGISKQLIPDNVLFLQDDGTNPPPGTTNVWLEAECASIIGSAWEVISDAAASQGNYLKSVFGNSSGNAPPTDLNKLLTFNFSVSTAGQYKVFSRQRESGTASDDSFWIKVNNSAWTQFNMGGAANAFFWQAVGTLYSLQAGNNTITIGIREDDAQLDKFYVTLDGSLPTTEGGAAENCSVPPPPVTEVWLETECADNIGSAWETLSDPAASGDSYLKVIPGNSSANVAPTDPDKQLIFNFSVSAAGQYKIFTRQRETGQNIDDSFWARVNNGSWILVGMSGSANVFNWESLEDNATYTLQAGTNAITIGTREDNAQLDKLYVTLDGSQPTGEGDGASNCGNARTASTANVPLVDEKVTDVLQPTLSAYPNPSNGSITVKLPDGDQQTGVLTLTDVSGKVVHRQVVGDAGNVPSLSIPTNQLRGGMYLLRWQQEKDQQTFKLFVNR